MVYSIFDYQLISILQYQEEVLDKKYFPRINFEYKYSIQKETDDKYKITTTSLTHILFDDKYKRIKGESVYLVNQEPYKEMIVELVYQHLSRQSNVIYNISVMSILLKVPTIGEITQFFSY